ncbi:MAG: TSUP family transporter [bacterium]
MGLDNIIAFDLPFWQMALIIVTSLLGSALTAATGIGGGIILIAVMSALLPAGAVVPVHGGIMIGSNVGRTGFLLRHVDWTIVKWFAVGGIIGGMVGAPIAGILPAWALRLAIAVFILWSQWGAKPEAFQFGPRGIMAAGAVSNFLTLFVGASGPFMTTLIAKIKTIRQQMVATTGACMSLQHSIKVIIFAISGFAFSPWLALIGLAILAGFVGSFIGTRWLGRIDETLFRLILKYLLTGLAVLLLIMVAQSFLAGN